MNHTRSASTLLLILAITLLASPAYAKLRLPAWFSDHMVLQRDKDVTIWGSAKANEEIIITFANQRVTATADATGAWRAALAPMQASREPAELTVATAAGETYKIANVLVGEVWLCSGQSNMQFPAKKTRLGKKLTNLPDQPMIRLAAARSQYLPQPATNVSANWQPCTADTVAGFSAVAYHFAQHLYNELNVPIGVIAIARGGTIIESWLPAESFERTAALKPYADEVRTLATATEATVTQPTTIYNGMIHPLAPMAMRGILWYQGESNCLKGDTAGYADMMAELARVWRERFEQPDMPFYFVQLAPYVYTQAPEGWQLAKLTEESLPRFWDAQRRALDLIPNSGMVVITDTVPNERAAHNIHPRIKDVVGDRLALLALARTYGRPDTLYCGPCFRSMTVQDGKAVLHFDHLGSGLAIRRKPPLTGFLIAGPDKKFVPAEANIVGGTVEVSSPEVAQPTAVRYAWDQTGAGNLMNAESFPASPFRTDAW